MIEVFLICLGFGCFSGLIAGLFGIGGGLVIVPFLLVLLQAQGVASDLWMIMAVATSLATIIVTSSAATLTHHYLNGVKWLVVRYLSAGIIIGVMLGAWVADFINDDSLRFIFAVYMLYAAIQMAFKGDSVQSNAALKPFQGSAFNTQSAPRITSSILPKAGVVIGFVASVLGVGGGTLIVPFLAKQKMQMRHVIAISSACGLPLAAIGTLSYAMLGWDKTGLPEGSMGYVYLPAFLGIVISSVFMTPVGARLATRLPTERLKRYFSILLFIVALKMFWGVFSSMNG